MGGTPKLAMNILCIPKDLDKQITGEILRGGYEKVKEAEAVICGGHTIKDAEPKYGLCVSGFVQPDKILKNSTAQEGDILILTKALGTGILNTAIKAGLLLPSTEKALSSSMIELNNYAAAAMNDLHISSCTDITGFGLLGHAYEMADGSEKSLIIDSSSVPLLPQTLEMAEMGIVPKGAYNNRAWTGCSIDIAESVPLSVSDALFDPQTSGGLLVALPEEDGLELVKRLRESIPVCEIIGRVENRRDKPVYVI